MLINKRSGLQLPLIMYNVGQCRAIWIHIVHYWFLQGCQRDTYILWRHEITKATVSDLLNLFPCWTILFNIIKQCHSLQPRPFLCSAVWCNSATHILVAPPVWNDPYVFVTMKFEQFNLFLPNQLWRGAGWIQQQHYRPKQSVRWCQVGPGTCRTAFWWRR